MALQGGIAIPAIPLTLSGTGASSNPPGALVNVSGNNSYASPITIGSGGATIYSASAGNTLTLAGGNISNGSNVLAVAGSGMTAISGLVTGSLTNTGNLVLSGSYSSGGTSIQTPLWIQGNFAQTSGGTLGLTVTSADLTGSSPALIVTGTASLVQVSHILASSSATEDWWGRKRRRRHPGSGDSRRERDEKR